MRSNEALQWDDPRAALSTPLSAGVGPTMQDPNAAFALIRTPPSRLVARRCSGSYTWTPLAEYLRRIQERQGTGYSMPDFDPCDGGVHAKLLFRFEAPGPRAVGSFISRNNPDQTASERRREDHPIRPCPPNHPNWWKVLRMLEPVCSCWNSRPDYDLTFLCRNKMNSIRVGNGANVNGTSQTSTFFPRTRA